jgi:hypothetical protein
MNHGFLASQNFQIPGIVAHGRLIFATRGQCQQIPPAKVTTIVSPGALLSICPGKLEWISERNPTCVTA